MSRPNERGRGSPPAIRSTSPEYSECASCKKFELKKRKLDLLRTANCYQGSCENLKHFFDRRLTEAKRLGWPEKRIIDNIIKYARPDIYPRLEKRTPFKGITDLHIRVLKLDAKLKVEAGYSARWCEECGQSYTNVR